MLLNIKLNTFLKSTKTNILNMFLKKNLLKELNIRLLKNPLFINHNKKLLKLSNNQSKFNMFNNKSNNQSKYNMFNNQSKLFNMFNNQFKSAKFWPNLKLFLNQLQLLFMLSHNMFNHNMLNHNMFNKLLIMLL